MAFLVGIVLSCVTLKSNFVFRSFYHVRLKYEIEFLAVFSLCSPSLSPPSIYVALKQIIHIFSVRITKITHFVSRAHNFQPRQKQLTNLSCLIHVYFAKASDQCAYLVNRTLANIWPFWKNIYGIWLYPSISLNNLGNPRHTKIRY